MSFAVASHSGRFYILEISFPEESADELIDGNPPSPMNGTVRVFNYLEDKVLTDLLGHVHFMVVF